MNVHQWLNSTQNYHTGVALYDKLGTSAVWKKVLAQGETTYNKQRLRELLKEIASKEPDLPVKPVAKPTEPNVSDILATIKAEWIPLYKEMSHLHAQLPHVTQKERGEMAFRILELEKQINQLWQKEKYVQAYGHLPDVQIQTTHDLSTQTGIHKRILNLRTSISKHKDNPNRQADVEKWQAEKAALEEKLKTLNT